MSKKLLAVASATALALSALVGVAPAMANTPAVTFTTVDGSTSTAGAGTAAAPKRQNVPDENTLAGNDSGTIAIANTLAGDVVNIQTSGKVRIVSAQTAGSAEINVTTLGTQNWTSTRAADGTTTMYVSVTDTVATEIRWSVTRTGSITSGSLWIQGRAGQAYHVTDIVAPATLARAASTEVRFKVTDVFGNQLETATIAGAVAGAANTVDAAWDAGNKWHDATITSSTNRAFILTLDGVAGTNPTDVVGFADTTITALVVVNGASSAPAAVSTQVSTLTAQVAALTTQLAASVTKKKYNKLARKWNRANPSNRVKLAR